MKASRPGVLAAITVCVGAVVWVVLHLTYADLPVLPWTAVPTLLLLTLGEAFTGYNIRSRINRKPDDKTEIKPVEPLVVARMAALAKASALAAAALAGVFAGFAAYLSGSLDKPTPRHDFAVSTGTFVSAVALVAAALFLEYSCRVPKDPDDDPTRRTGA